jgi:Subtilase family
VINRSVLIAATFLLSLTTLAQPAFQRNASDGLWKEITAVTDTDSLDISLRVSDHSVFEIKNFRILESYFSANIFFVRAARKDVSALLNHPSVSFADLRKQAKEELTTGSLDITLNRINMVHNRYAAINGDSMVASVKEQRFDTTDIDYKNRIIESGQAATTFTTHASVMSTIIAGGGNTSPFAKGAAPSAYLTSATFASLLPHTDSVYRRYNISLQNHSYGTVIENFYGNEATAYDASVLLNPVLLHVFSSGNSGTSNAATGIYTASPGYSNLTGNFKSAKNVLVVGATDSFGVVAPLSSRGPAYDGRVKPEVVAFGEDGSSGAAAMTSGAALLVQQRYKKNYNRLPSTALVRAAVMNGADDVANPHVDYLSGYGSLNAFNAVNAIGENRFVEDSLLPLQTKTFTVTLPAGLKELKIMLAWTDALPASNAPKALVNDLDLNVIHTPTATSWLPWVLDPRPANILLPAQRKTDTLNNQEQVTIDNPLPGNYIIEVKGTKVTTARQLFAITWQQDSLNKFLWTFPTSSDQITGGKSNVLRWESNLTGNAALEYSTNGVVWTNISGSVDLSAHYFRWNAPDSFAKAWLRIKPIVIPDIVSDSFMISRATSVTAGFNCADSFMLQWKRLPVLQYELYELGSKYLQPFLVTADSFVILKKTLHPSLYYAVAPIVAGKPGLRSYALKYDAQGVDCYFRSFYIQLQTNEKVDFTASIGSLYNVASITIQKLSGSIYKDLQTITAPSVLQFAFSDTNLLRGIGYYRLQLKLTNGSVVYSDIVPVYHYPDLPVIVFPNPVQQARPVRIISQEPGKYSVTIVNMAGMKIFEKHLANIDNYIPGGLLAKGMYLFVITKDEGRVGVTKLVVY